jgi:ParB/RepB/Spo0J family partition protein
VTATLTMVPLEKIHSSKDNPRTDFADEQMAELIASVKRHGIITPLTLTPDGEDSFTIIAGERRYRAAKAAKLNEVAAQVRDANGDTLTLAIAENVIRADLTPIEEARAYRRLADEHGSSTKVARMVGRSERLIAERPAPARGAATRGHRRTAEADRQGIYEPRELATSNVLGKLAARVGPPSVKKHNAEQDAERERVERAPQDAQTVQRQDEGEATE